MTTPFNKYFDHTLLKADASPDDIIALCREAVMYGFASVCVNSRYVPLAVRTLRDLQEKHERLATQRTDEQTADEPSAASYPPVFVTSVIGFPLGAMAKAAKVFEAETALKAGAHDIDMVISIGAVKAGNYPAVAREVEDVKKTVDRYGGTLKVILETCLLTESEITLAAGAACEGGTDFLKTSTGFGPGGATIRDLALMQEAAAGWAAQQTPPAAPAKLKASGGIRDLKTANEMIAAGASRLGTSATVAIIKEYYEAGFAL